MSIYLQCHWSNCSEIGAFECTCKQKPFIGCQNHIGMHFTSEANLAHQHSQILLKLTPSDSKNIKTAYEKVNLRSQIEKLVAERNRKIKVIEKEYSDKIRHLINMDLQIKMTIKNIEATNALPIVSKNSIACLLAQLKQNSSLKVKNVSSLMKLNEEQSKELLNQLQHFEGTYSIYQRSLTIPQLVDSSPIAELPGHENIIRSIDFSSDGRYIASSSNDGFIKIWDFQSKSKLYDLQGHEGAVCAVRFMPYGFYLVSGGSDKRLIVWDVQNQSCYSYHTQHSDVIRAVAVSHNGNIVASGGMDDTIVLWDFSTVRTLKGHSNGVLSLEFTKCDRFIFSASVDSTIRVWNIGTMNNIASYCGHFNQINCISLSRDGKYLASACSDKTLKIWDIETAQNVRSFDDSTFSFSCVSYSHDGQSIVSADVKGNIKVWDLATTQLKYVLKKNAQRIYAMKHSVCGHFVASGGADRVLRIWKIV